LLQPLFLPYTLGSVIGAMPIGFLAYRATLAFIRARRRHQHSDPGASPSL
jgi:uncharacterized protein (DUF2062 family)